jgi:phosphatidylinositol-3-phosphatase
MLVSPETFPILEKRVGLSPACLQVEDLPNGHSESPEKQRFDRQLGKRIGPRRHRVILLAVLLVASVIPSLLTAHASAPSGKYFDYVVTILMENNDLPSVLAQGPYQAGLANQYTLAKGYSAVSHPSEPNYSVLISGQIGVNNDDGLCCGQDNHQNLVDNLESHGLTWKAFAEDLTTGDCTGGRIDTDHFPFLYFSDITNSPSRCNSLVGATASSDPELMDTLSAPSNWPNYVWLTPNATNDAHNTDIGFGDRYLSGIVPKILGSNVFMTQRAALFIVYDEGNGATCSGGLDCVYASWSGSTAKKGYTSSTGYTHYSYLHTIEDNWGLPTLTSDDASAPVMSEFFTGYSGSGGITGVLQYWPVVIILAAVIAAAVLIGVKIIPASKRRRRRSS